MCNDTVPSQLEEVILTSVASFYFLVSFPINASAPACSFLSHSPAFLLSSVLFFFLKLQTFDLTLGGWNNDLVSQCETLTGGCSGEQHFLKSHCSFLWSSLVHLLNFSNIAFSFFTQQV